MDEGQDEDTHNILKSIQEESKATEPSMPPHYLQEAPDMGDANTQVMTSRMDGPVIDLERDGVLNDVLERDDSIDLS